MKKNIIWFCIITAAILTIGIIILSKVLADDEEVVLADAMKIISSQDSYVSTSGEVRALAYYGDMYMSGTEKKNLLRNLAKGLGIEGDYTFETATAAVWESGKDTIYIYKEAAFSQTKLSVITLESQMDGKNTYAQYILCELDIDDSPESVCYYADVISGELKLLGLDDEVTITLISYYEGVFDLEKKSELVDEILEGFDAEIVVESRTEELFSVYAYVDGMKEGIKVGKDDINLNIAINYNEATNQTRVYLAAPIIDMEY